MLDVTYITTPKPAILAPLEKVQDSEYLPYFEGGNAIRYRDTDLVVYPHTIKNCTLFSFLGYDIPIPNIDLTKWVNGEKIEPKPLQLRTVNAALKNPILHIFNEIGTGKTYSAIWAFHLLKQAGFVNRALILTPLSTVEDVWEKAFNNLYPEYNLTVMHHANKTKRIGKLLNPDTDVFVCNHEGFRIIADYLPTNIDIVIIDEAHTYRNRTKTKFSVVEQWLEERDIRWRWLMTGTPTPQAATDSWALARLAGRNLVEFNDYQSRLMYKAGMRWIHRSDAYEQAHTILQPAIRETRADLGIVEPTIISRKIEFTPEQTEAFNALKEDMEAQLGDTKISAVHEADLLNKLLQVCCGILYYKTDEEKPASIIFPTKRFKEVEELIKACNEKVIVYFPFKETIFQAEEYFSKTKYGTVTVHGRVPSHKRKEVFDKFREDSNTKILLAHPKCMAHGLTLNEATLIIWFTATHSNDAYTQANGRNSRLGQTKNTLIAHLRSTSEEKMIYSRLAEKKKMQGVLLEMFK